MSEFAPSKHRGALLGGLMHFGLLAMPFPI